MEATVHNAFFSARHTTTELLRIKEDDFRGIRMIYELIHAQVPGITDLEQSDRTCPWGIVIRTNYFLRLKRERTVK